ncbi:glycosyltransferase [Acinetobacter indicus]|uniref:glycosyltransferase n=1 Tax=Acinetobacter indicus TaxID=756892 RepID=UPI000CEBF6DC|nr:glycosyltransferase [Acinetobacter indicus]
MSKKIYFVVHNFSNGAGGGVNRVVSETANELSKDKNIDVNILSLSSLNDGVAYHVTENVKLHSLNMKRHSTTQYKGVFKLFWLLSAYLNVMQFYFKQKESSTWNLTSPPLIILFALMYKGKNIFLNCEHISPQRKKTSKFLEYLRKLILNRADLTISLNKSDHNYYIKHGVKSKLIYNGVKFPEKLELNREKTIIFVGRFEDQKNPLAALEIFYESLLWKDGYVLKFFGSGCYHKDILDKASDYKILDYIKVITDEKNPDNIYSGASCLIMTSRYEGLPMVLIEAMARGVPCISYDCPNGPSEIIIDKVNGFLVKNNDKQCFINSIHLVNSLNINHFEIVNSSQPFNVEVTINEWKNII